MNTHVESPRERALKDITAAILSLEEVEYYALAGGWRAEALEIRARLERLKEAVEGV